MTVVYPGGPTASVTVIYQFAAPTAAVAIGTTATTISTAQVPAVSVGVCDIIVKWGMLSLSNTATTATSVTVSATVGGSLANLNGITPNVWLGAASAGGAIQTANYESAGGNINTSAPFTVTLSALASAAAVNAYLRINGTITVEAYIPGTI
jgi:hypothetical protein